MKYVEAFVIKILIEVRRCGKSTLLHLIMNKLIEEKHISSEQIKYYLFVSMEYDNMSQKICMES